MEEKVQKLSEGMDFIEEATSFSNESLSYTDMEEIQISESERKPSPYKILGVAKGCFAPIGEFSRNKRWYSENLWPTVLQNPEFQSRLKSRSILGCIMHEDKLVDDFDISQGKVSHIVSVLEVKEDQKTGKPFLYGELEILDTPAGRILEAMYKGGANLYVSSRAAGKLFPAGPGLDYSIVKPEQYHVHTFDIVCRPGFLKARPMYEEVPTPKVSMTNEKVEESLNTSVNENKEVKDNIEENETIAHLSSQLTKLTKIVEKVVGDVYELPENVDSIEEGRKPGESDEEMKTRLHKELVHQADDKADKAREKGDWKEYKKQHDKLDKLDDISPVANAYASEDLRKAAIPAVLQLLKESDMSEEAFSNILDTIMKGLKQ